MKHDAPLVAIVVLVVLAGCVRTPTNVYHEIDYDGEITAGEQFRMVGQVEVDSGAAPDRTFDDVRITLYDADESVLRSVLLGDMATNVSVAPVTRTVNVTAEEIPRYVVIESPDFWSGDGLPEIAFRLVDGRCDPYIVLWKAEKFPS